MSKKLKLIIVDDEQDNLDLLYRTFRREFKVYKASNPLDALEILDTEGEMAVMISDQSMPEMTGIQLFEKTTELFPNTKCILLTGYSEEALTDEPNTRENVVFKCITKPFAPDELKTVVQAAAEIYKTTMTDAD
jgi:DNA-binding NtrC family response regulator